MRLIRQALRRRFRCSKLEQCALALCVSLLCLAQACFSELPLAHPGAPAPDNGIGTASPTENADTLVCNTSRINTDAILPRALDNDPLLAFLSQVARLAFSVFPERETTGHRLSRFQIKNRPPPDVAYPYLGSLVRSLQLRC